MHTSMAAVTAQEKRIEEYPPPNTNDRAQPRR